jgi:hypothetical protein
MRLLNTKTRELESFFGKPAPAYAIFSHTWREGEVTFEEFDSIEAKKKPGYLKIKQACLQAEKDGLGWIWIDTCGIDKRSSAELSEAINSMFRWYQKADVCYAFLDDIHLVEQFDQARWFSRGWTLQELIAPREVRFFNSKWEFIGERSDLASRIKSVTGINMKALRSLRLDYLRSISIAKRMSWAADRHTTRDEDLAYCLMGLFNVNMPLLYGEGWNAFRRLQEEIMRLSTDQTIFVHYRLSDSPLSAIKHRLARGGTNLLAKHPVCFESSRKLHRIENQEQSFQLTNRELAISMPMYQVAESRTDYVAIPACHEERYLSARIGIRLRSITPTDDAWFRSFLALLRLPMIKPQFGLPTFVRLPGVVVVDPKDLNRAQMMKFNVLRDAIINDGRTRFVQLSEVGTALVGFQYRKEKDTKLLITPKNRVFEILGNPGPMIFDGIFHIPDWGCFTAEVKFNTSRYTATAAITGVHPRSVTIEDCDRNDASWTPPPGTQLIVQASDGVLADDSLCLQDPRPGFWSFGHRGRAFSVSVAWQIILGREVLVLTAQYEPTTMLKDIFGDDANKLAFLRGRDQEVEHPVISVLSILGFSMLGFVNFIFILPRMVPLVQDLPRIYVVRLLGIILLYTLAVFSSLLLPQIYVVRLLGIIHLYTLAVFSSLLLPLLYHLLVTYRNSLAVFFPVFSSLFLLFISIRWIYKYK